MVAALGQTFPVVARHIPGIYSGGVGLRSLRIPDPRVGRRWRAQILLEISGKLLETSDAFNYI
jgi:hypothetical protein